MAEENMQKIDVYEKRFVIEEIKRQIGGKVDSGNVITHKFENTDPVNIRHTYGSKPVGAIAIKQSDQSRIDCLSTTRNEITMQSTVSNITATILLI